MYMLYLDLIMSFMRLILYAIFICIMFKVHTLPIFALRPMYLAIRTFRKALSDIVLSRRAIKQLELYPSATEEELNSDNTCIICREEMVPGNSAKKLPCGHIFHAACLRSWFQRQQTCPTCRLDVLRARTPQNRQNDQQRRQAHLAQLQAQLRGQGLGNLVPELLNLDAEINPPAANPAGNENGNRQNPQNITITGNGNLNQLGNILQIPNLLHGLNNDPLPPPPPMPPVDLAKLTEHELKLMESVERKGLEARVRHLREIRVLLDAAVFRMDEYMRVAPSAGFSATDHITPANLAEQTAPVPEPEVAPEAAEPEVTHPPPESDSSDHTNEPIENVNEAEEDPAPDELRRRRLAAFDNLDLD